MPKLKTYFFVFLIGSSITLQAQREAVVVTNLVLHSIVAYLLQDVHEPVYVGKTIDVHEQVKLIDAQLLIFDSRSEDIQRYIKLYFSGKNQKQYDLKDIPTIGLEEFVYWPDDVGRIVIPLVQILKEEFPEYAKNINDNFHYFERELSKYSGKATRKDFFNYVRSPEILDVSPEERYFIILAKLGLLMRGH